MKVSKYIEGLLNELKGAKDDAHAALIRTELRASGHTGPESDEPKTSAKKDAGEAPAS